MQSQVVLLASASDSGISAWDLHTCTHLTSYRGNSSPRNGLCRLGHDYLAAAQTSKHALHFWTWHKDQVLQRSFVAEAVHAVAASPDGLYVAGGGASGTVYIWEAGTGRLLRTWSAHYKSATMLMFVGGAGVLVTAGEDTLVHAWLVSELLDASLDPSSMAYVRPQPLHAWSDHTLPVQGLCCGAGEANALIGSCSLDRTVKLRRLGDGALLRSIALPCALNALVLDPGEHALYAAGSDGTVYEVPLLGDGSSAPAAAAAAAGGAGAAGSSGGSGELFFRLEGHSRAVTCLALSPDGESLVSGSDDGAARVWDMRSRQPVQVIQNPGKFAVSCVLVLRQPPFLVAGSSSGETHGSASGRPGPKRMQALAPLAKYAGTSTSAKPWEGAPVILDGSLSLEPLTARGAALGLPPAPSPQAAFGLPALLAAALPAASGAGGCDDWDIVLGVAADRAAGPATAAAGAPQAMEVDGGGGGDVGEGASLEDQVAALKGELEAARAQAARWQALHSELHQFCVDRVVAGVQR